MKESTGRLLLAIIGSMMVLGFFLPWVDAGAMLGTHLRISGYRLVQITPGWTWEDTVMAFVPLSGLALLGTALFGGRAVRPVALTTGALVLGYPLYKTVQAFFHVTGWGLWMIFAGAFVAIFAALATKWGDTKSR